MLVITRHPGDSFTIGDDIKVIILEVSGDKIKVGIEAPRSVRIMRSEVMDTEKSNQEADLSGGAQALDLLKTKLSSK